VTRTADGAVAIDKDIERYMTAHGKKDEHGGYGDRALLVAAREAVKFMPDGGRIIAITYAPGGRTGAWQPWVAMGSAKAAMESLCRYFAVALATRRITVNAVSPGATEDSVFNTLPPEVLQMLRKWAESGWVPMRRLTTPADVGNVVALLCSEEAGFVTA
jgi:NAD(P)-dependent dehydrogenase (short-subunit alcohol dehydrogenase family)